MDDRGEGVGKTVGRCAFAGVFIASGVAHFAATGFFVKAMPDYLPQHRAMVLVSGAIEILLGLLLLIPRTRRLAAWGLVALLVAVFPANVNIYLHRDQFPPFPFSDLAHLIRLPFQGVLIYWAYGQTGPSRPGSIVGPLETRGNPP